jgi:ElaB/YqjD/DUF883 family membrane-anchored ribosome-binding protein
VRLHLPPQATTGGALRPVLAGSLEAQHKDGTPVQATVPLLSLPVVSAEAFAALPEDETVASRLKEVLFADASLRAREMIHRGEFAQARTFMRQQRGYVEEHPWLLEKLDRMIELADSDAQMAAKELRYRANRLNTRVAEAFESQYTGDETDMVDKPAYLRRKAEEGKGRRKP